MFPPAFDYYRADSVADAIELLERHAQSNPAVIAGGHGLVPAMKTGRPTPGLATRGTGTHTRGAPNRSAGRLEDPPGVLIDISDVDTLGGIDDSDDESVHVGPLVTHATLVDSLSLATYAPVLVEAASEVGDEQVRNRGTVGGNLADADPAADLPAAVLAADAVLHARGPTGDRTIAAAEFFEGPHETALGASELLVDIELPTDRPADRDRRDAYVRKTHPATGYAIVGVAVVLETGNDVIWQARVGATGVQSHAVRLTAVEDALAGVAISDSAVIEQATELAGKELDDAAMHGDEYASAEYRRSLLGTYARYAIDRALGKAAGGLVGTDGGDDE